MDLTSLLWSFEGRISRAEFWLGILLSYLAFAIVFACSALAVGPEGARVITYVGWVLFVLAVHAKRYHDLGRSVWWALIVLVPLGPIWTLIECGCREGMAEPNAYGPVPKGPTRKQRRLALVGSGFAVASFAIPLIYNAFKLRDSIVFFNSPTDVVEKHVKPGVRMRIGGLVQPGSVVRSENLAIRFDVTDGKTTLPVSYQGLLPDLFREGQGVVAEGALQVTGMFKADSVLAKHDENYMPKEVADALKKQGHWKDEYGKKVGAAPKGRAQ